MAGIHNAVVRAAHTMAAITVACALNNVITNGCTPIAQYLSGKSLVV